MTETRIQIDLTKQGVTEHLVHIRGYYGDEGENEGVLSITATIAASPNYPQTGRILVAALRRVEAVR